MITTMNKPSVENVISFEDSMNLENYSCKELIDMTINNDGSEQALHAKHELMCRGKDDIRERISIKKKCKGVILELEKEFNSSNGNEEISQNNIKLSKQKFLTTVSLVDKLQLEWQRYDLALKH